MRILVFILALMSAFFVSAEDLDLVPAKQVKSDGRCTWGSEVLSDSIGFFECSEIVRARLNMSHLGEAWQEQGRTPIQFKVGSTGNYTSPARYSNFSTSYECPPSEGSPYTNLVNGNMCSKPQDCPAGYHSRGASKALGSDSCVPKECPPTGSSESLFSSPTIGGVPFDGGGLYCNDGCAYNVNPSQISLGKYAIGVSQGVACGDKPYDNKKLADDADSDQCTTSTDGTVSVLQCPDYDQPDPEDNPLDNSDSKVDESETPDKSKETCAEGDTSCNLKNVETEIENSINNLIDNNKELHNKKIDADTKNAKAFLNVMESIDTAILLQTSQDERLHAVTVGKFNELIDAVNGIETGGGGGGGNGTGNGNIGGQDCEGTIEECAGIGSGDGVELPQETRNLEQYAQ